MTKFYITASSSSLVPFITDCYYLYILIIAQIDKQNISTMIFNCNVNSFDDSEINIDSINFNEKFFSFMYACSWVDDSG